MTEQIMSALGTGAFWAMMFPNTRNMGIIATSPLAFLAPKPILVVVFLGAAIFIYKKVFSK